MIQPNTQISVLGTGKMGSVVGRTLADAGLRIVYGSRSPEESADKFADLPNVTVTGYKQGCTASDYIVVAVPWANTLDLIEKHRDCLADKIIIDLTNPTSADWSCLVTPTDSSAAEQIADASGSPRVVKAFNGITADNFRQPRFSGEPAQVFYCGNDPEAKSEVRELIQLCGYKPVDCGSLENARYLESLAMLWVQLAFWEEWGNEFSFRVVGASQAL